MSKPRQVKMEIEVIGFDPGYDPDYDCELAAPLMEEELAAISPCHFCGAKDWELVPPGEGSYASAPVTSCCGAN